MCAVFFFNDTATTEIYTLSLHDALPIFERVLLDRDAAGDDVVGGGERAGGLQRDLVLARAALVVAGGDLDVELLETRSEEHTSELQSRQYLVCRLLLEKKNTVTRHTPER